MNRGFKTIWDVLWYVVVFILIQFVVEMGAALIWGHYHGEALQQVVLDMANGQLGWLVAITSVTSSLITILLFTICRWAPVARTWLRTRPWAVLFWVVMLTIGTILPSEWLYELMQIKMPEQTEALFEGIMKEPWGYLAIGIFVPVAEELVFRGAILRVLLNLFDRQMHWVAIVISALIFGAIHMNLAQGIHAFILGLLLGWMYYRTQSVIPGIALHWVNNSVAYVMFNLMPDMEDGKLIDLFHGNDTLMYGGLACSLCILLPSLFQLYVRMRRS
jgi:membrane protease YdiL (CAAX protease family)